MAYLARADRGVLHHPCAGDDDRREAEALNNLVRACARTRPPLYARLASIEHEIEYALTHDDAFERETRLDNAAASLRTAWLQDAAAEASAVFRSPTVAVREALEHRQRDAYGYERDFHPERLEARCSRFFDAPPEPWSASHLLFSSAQAGLASLLMCLGQAKRAKLKVFHAGAYFETKDLIRQVARSCDRATNADCAIVEPIACEGRFISYDPRVIAATLRPAQCLIVDETLLAPRSEIPGILRAAAGRDLVVVRVISALKLLQQGLELANVGIVSVYAERQDRVDAHTSALKRCRTLSGASLRFVDALALEAPFFLEAGTTAAYAERIFAHNECLERALAKGNNCFKPVESLGISPKPYCTFQLRRANSALALESLAARIGQEAYSRRLAFERGGSFGFRGHRYDVIGSKGESEPFLRVALGARGGATLDGIVALLTEIAGRGK